MNTSDVIKLLSARLGANQKLTRQALKQVLSILRQRLIAGDAVTLSGLGKLQVKESKGRYGYIPGKGRCYIPARQQLRFNQHKTIKDDFAADKDD
ncbi:MAG: HU family DNA-binding protein [Gammaproteobacteria bacterium]|nr:HU family DNA-binding protein [Gammaproteobacteria bacterium]